MRAVCLGVYRSEEGLPSPMLDIKPLRQDPKGIEGLLQRRNPDFSIAPVLQLDEERRQLLQEEEGLRNQRNQLNKTLATLKKEGAST